MKYILCYGDSNTWGYIPETDGERYEYDERWTGVAAESLGEEYHIYENALNGRTTVFEDPIEEGRNGRDGFEATLMENAPLDAVVMFLGVNDTKTRFKKEPWDIAWGMDLLIGYIEKSRAGRDKGIPKVLLVSPIPVGDSFGKSILGTLFDDDSRKKSYEIAGPYETIAKMHGCAFLNPADFIRAGADGIHLTKEDQRKLGLAIADKLKEMLEE